MTSEQRLDRLERIAKLVVRAGVHARRREREQDDKINIIIDAQVKNEERFAKLAEAQTELAISQDLSPRHFRLGSEPPDYPRSRDCLRTCVRGWR